MKKGKKARIEEDERPYRIRTFMSNLLYISVQFSRFSQRRNGEQLKDPWDVYTRWLHYSKQVYEEQTLAGVQPTSKVNMHELYLAKDSNEFWRSADPYYGLDLKWDIKIGDKAYRRFINMPIPTREAVLTWLLEIAAGTHPFWTSPNILREGPCLQMVAFSSLLTGGNLVLWLIQMHRIPRLKNQTVTHYEYHPHIHIADFLRQETKLTSALDQYLNTIQSDSSKWLQPDGTLDELRDIGFVTFSKSVNIVNRRYLPIQLAAEPVSMREAQRISLVGNRWIRTENPDEKTAESSTPSMETYLTQLNSEVLSQLADAESCKGFIRLLETIPNFRIKLTEQERDLIGTPGNVLAIGRSGTGKTTCALLRLFASEVLFKYRSQHVQAGQLRLVNTRFEAEDLDSRFGLHIVFVTASPVLTNEVKRFYWRLNDHIKEELTRRNELRKKYQESEAKEYDVIEDQEGELELRRQMSDEKEEIKIEEEENEEEEEVVTGNTVHSLAQIGDQDFPFFATVRRLVLMVDATLRNPFFSRNANGAIIGMNAGSEWHNELKGVLMINKQYKHSHSDSSASSSSESSDSDSEEDPEITTETSSKSNKLTKKLSFEIDYDYFLRHFYPKIAQKCSCGALTLWTEIVAYIKGSAESHRHPGWYLPKLIYCSLGKKTSFLHQEDRARVWDLFIEYERWKVNLGAYDFQDVVNYQLFFIQLHGYFGVPIHYMMIDEVQDLTHATLLLLGKITEQSLFFSGDTAQTIAKGVGFRFCDLRSLFYRDSGLNMDEPSVCQLTINFRSHGRILDLANSVVSLLEALFPRTIDKMAKEKSHVDGPKPMILQSQSEEELFILLFGANKYQAGATNPIEFGCDQVIIVRNQEEKERLPSVLKGALCLTVYESKGLEFDDVVLYNFFTHSEVPENQWRILEQLLISEEKSEEVVRNFDGLEVMPLKVKLENVHFEDVKYSSLCTELKMLYVAITRPRKRLIMFDTQVELRQYVLQYWLKLNVVDLLQVQSSSTSTDILNTTSGQEVIESIAQSTSAAAWKSQGLKMMRHHFYDQAQKCFEYAGEAQLREKARCYCLANEAAESIAKGQQTIEMKKFLKETVSKADKSIIKTEKMRAIQKFLTAAENFEQLGLIKQAAKCYFSAQENRKAAVLFEACAAWGQCAEALSACQDWVPSGHMFVKAGEYTRAIDVFRKAKAWEEILECIQKFGSIMTEKEREGLIKKYIPIALEELMPKLVPVGEEDRVHLSAVEVEEAKQVVIEENSEDSESSEEEKISETDSVAGENPISSDPVVSSEGPNTEENPPVPNPEETPSLSNPEEKSFLPKTEENPSLDSSIISLSSSIDTSSLLISAQPLTQSTNPFTESANPFMSLPPADTSVTDEIQSLPSDTASVYSIISGGEGGVEVDDRYKLEMLSQYDPEDEWLQVEKGSVADSIHTAVQKDGSVSFDYSIFDNTQAVALNLGGHLIRPKADIYVEDEIMRRILQYISMFSQDVRSYLLTLRSADTLTITESIHVDWKIANMIDLDEVDVTLISTVLDTLEYFQLYKLCLVVCNRYSLADRLGRYVTSLAHKYSSLPDLKSVNNDKMMVFMKEKSTIAYTALHNVFEMINPEILSPKNPKEEKSLGIRCFQSLLLLGYWKKCVYLLDKINALAVTATFSDYKNYKILYNTANIDQNQCFSWVKTEENELNIEAKIVAIDEAANRLNRFYNITLKSNFRKEEVNLSEEKFPNWAEFNGAFWEFLGERSQETMANLKRHIVAACYFIPQLSTSLSFTKSVSPRLHDIFSFLTLLLYSSRSTPPIRDLLDSLSVEHFDMFLKSVNLCVNLLLMKTNIVGYSQYHMSILYALLAPLGVKNIVESDVTRCLPITSHLVINRNSLFSPLISDKIVPIDLEGDFLLCPIDAITPSIALEIVKITTELVNSRFRHWQGKKLNFDTIENLPSHENSVKTAACLFGEFAFISEIQLQFPKKFPNNLQGLKPYDGFNEEETELESLERDLKKILALGTDSRAAMKYIRDSNAGIIDKLEKQIAELKRNRVNFLEIGRFNSLLDVIIRDMEWVIDSPPCITSTARNYLLTYAQNIVKSIRYDTLSDHTRKMTIVSRMFILCRSEILLLDLIRAKTHPMMVKGRKQAKVTNRFLEDLAWLDVEVYYRYGDWNEAGNTLLRYLDCEFGRLDIQTKVSILEKAVIFGVCSGSQPVILPKHYLDKLSNGVSPSPLHLTNPSLLLSNSLTWLDTLSPELSQCYFSFDDPESQSLFQTVMSLIVIILLNTEGKYANVLTSFDTLRNTLRRHLRNTRDNGIEQVLNVNKNSDIARLKRDVNKLHSRYVWGNFEEGKLNFVEIGRQQLDRNLEKALVEEYKQKSQIVTLDTKIVKLALKRKQQVGKLRPKLPPQVTLPTERISLHLLGKSLPESSVSQQIFTYWKSNRAVMRLYQTIFTYQWSLILYNQTVEFTNVLDRHHVLNQISYVTETFEAFQEVLLKEIEGEREGNVKKFVGNAEIEINDRLKSFEDWKKVVLSSKKLDATSKKKKKWDAQWKSKMTKSAETGQKKQKYLEYRAKMLKKTRRS